MKKKIALLLACISIICFVMVACSDKTTVEQLDGLSYEYSSDAVRDEGLGSLYGDSVTYYYGCDDAMEDMEYAISVEWSYWNPDEYSLYDDTTDWLLSELDFYDEYYPDNKKSNQTIAGNKAIVIDWEGNKEEVSAETVFYDRILLLTYKDHSLKIHASGIDNPECEQELNKIIESIKIDV